MEGEVDSVCPFCGEGSQEEVKREEITFGSSKNVLKEVKITIVARICFSCNYVETIWKEK